MTWTELLKRDHEVTERVLAAGEKAFAAKGGPTNAFIGMLVDYVTHYVDRCHNQKEEQHLFPLIEKRGIPSIGGPLAVMLAEHRQAKEYVAAMQPLTTAVLGGDRARLAELGKIFADYTELVKGHFWKENDILYPMALQVMQPEDGDAVVRGIEKLEASLGPGIRARYYKLADDIVAAVDLEDLAYGLDRKTLAAMLNALPLELSFIDADDTVRYFSHEHGDKIFGRTRGAIGTKVQNCHPQKSVHLVNQILAEFKAGKRSVAEFWIDMGPRKIHIRYWPVRDPDGRYLGCMETVQDVSGIQKLSGQRRLLDA
ncbi:MAG: DUF438 domain-containing protein [Deltaproteobacteria bacterium]|nr:DUF438 domain-containing protein [Deltaproteobacteria bacterium]